MEEVIYITAKEASDLSNKGREFIRKQELDEVYNKIYQACDRGETQIYYNIKYQNTVDVLKENGFCINFPWQTINWN
jgi:hypothetical protein